VRGIYNVIFDSPQPLLMALFGIVLSVYTAHDAYRAVKSGRRPSPHARTIGTTYLIVVVLLFVLNITVVYVLS